MSTKSRTPPDDPAACAHERPLEERHQGVNDVEDAADYWRSRGRSGPKAAVALNGGVASEGGSGRTPTPKAATRSRPRKRR